MNLLCDECHKPVRANEIGSYEQVIAWVQRREGGGAHGVSDARPTGKVLHEACWKDRHYGKPLF